MSAADGAQKRLTRGYDQVEVPSPPERKVDLAESIGKRLLGLIAYHIRRVLSSPQESSK